MRSCPDAPNTKTRRRITDDLSKSWSFESSPTPTTAQTLSGCSAEELLIIIPAGLSCNLLMATVTFGILMTLVIKCVKDRLQKY